MASYLLLRDNKESGPYTLNDLVSLGLKPYDLVWVEGRSAAWRYPSEIAELKEYSPVVEEQPFDRFFKKQETETVEQLLEKRLKIEREKKAAEQIASFVESKKQVEPKKEFAEPKKEEIQPVKPKPKPIEKEEEEMPYQAYQPRPKVFVSKPTPPRNNSYSANENNFREENQPQKQAASYSSYSAYSAAREEPVLEKKYSQSLDEIKEMYVNTLVQRKTRNKRKEIVKKYAKPVLASAFLVICGIVIGYFVLSKKVSLEATQGISTVTPKQEEQSSQQKNQILQPDANSTTTTLVDKKDVKPLNQQQQQLLLQQKTQVKTQQTQQTATMPASTDIAATTQTQTDDQTKTEKQNVEVDPQTNERNKVVRDDNGGDASKEKESRATIGDNDTKDLKKLVSVNANDYLRGIFGGIRDLKITVNNRSKYVLDAVTVLVEYVKVTNQPLRTETIMFKNISPNDASTIRLPDSQRGMRVTYHITNIESKQFQKNTALVN